MIRIVLSSVTFGWKPTQENSCEALNGSVRCNIARHCYKASTKKKTSRPCSQLTLKRLRLCILHILHITVKLPVPALMWKLNGSYRVKAGKREHLN